MLLWQANHDMTFQYRPVLIYCVKPGPGLASRHFVMSCVTLVVPPLQIRSFVHRENFHFTPHVWKQPFSVKLCTNSTSSHTMKLKYDQLLDPHFGLEGNFKLIRFPLKISFRASFCLAQTKHEWSRCMSVSKTSINRLMPGVLATGMISW